MIASIALFVSLGGVSYGLAKGSIGSREIKNNDVRTQDIRNGHVTTKDVKNNDVRGGDVRTGTLNGSDVADNSLTGADVVESALGTVPSASNAGSASRAGTANNANALGGVAPSGYASSQPEAVRRVGAAGQPAFQSGFTNYGGGFEPAGFYKDPFGIVHLVGDMIAPADGVAFTLPAGYRPLTYTRYAVLGNAVGNTAVRINPDDGGVFVALAGGTQVTLNGVTFRN